MKFRTRLIDGMLQRGYELSFAERIFDQICGFGEYGFPESHSASFAVLAYASAWLKYYYPEAFYTSLLNSLPMGFYSASQLVQDAQRHQVTVLPVCVNESRIEHTFQGQGQEVKAIRLGFRLVKGLSQQGVNMLLSSRPEQGYSTLCQIKAIGLAHQDLEALASAGAFRCFSDNRYATRWHLMDREEALPLLSSQSTHQLVSDSEDAFLFQPNCFENLLEDYAALGLSLEHHPITLLDQSGLLGEFVRANQLLNIPHQHFVTVVGVVTGRQSPGTAAGVTFMTLEDDTGNINVVVWAGTARAQKQPFLTAKVLKIRGILEREGEVVHVIAGKLTDMTQHLSHLRASSRDFH